MKRYSLLLAGFLVVAFSAGEPMACSTLCPLQTENSPRDFVFDGLVVAIHMLPGVQWQDRPLPAIIVRAAESIAGTQSGQKYSVVVFTHLSDCTPTPYTQDKLQKYFPPGTPVWVVAQPLGTNTAISARGSRYLEASQAHCGLVGRVTEGFSPSLGSVLELDQESYERALHDAPKDRWGDIWKFPVYDARRELRRLAEASTDQEAALILQRLVHDRGMYRFEPLAFVQLVRTHVQDPTTQERLLSLVQLAQPSRD